MSGSIFISYRRGADSNAAGRLNDRLEASFRRENLFFDVDAIPPGVDFVDLLQEKVDACDILLVVIGRGWLNARDEDGAPRLDNPEDFVRIEVARGLSARKHVIPILVDGASMPKAVTLPDDMKALARRNAAPLNHETFKADFDKLVRSLKQTLETIEAQREKQRQAREADAERLRIEREHADLAERRRAEEAEAARLQAEREMADLAVRVEAERKKVQAEEKRLAEEEAERKRLEQERIEVAERLRREQVEAEHQRAAKEAAEHPLPEPVGRKRRRTGEEKPGEDSLAAVGRPSNRKQAATEAAGPDVGKVADQAVMQGARQEEPRASELEQRAWNHARSADTPTSYGAYLGEWPAGRWAGEAKRRADAAEARDKAELAAWLTVSGGGQHADIAAFVARWPEGRFAFQAKSLLANPVQVRRKATRRNFLVGGGAALVAGAATAPFWVPALIRSIDVVPDHILRGHTQAITDVNFHRGGRFAASASGDRTAIVWNVNTGEIETQLELHTDVVMRAVFAPLDDEVRLLTSADDYTARIWSGFTRGENGRNSFADSTELAGHTAFVKDAAWSPDGSRVVTGGGAEARVWNGRDGQLVRALDELPDPVGRVAFTPDGLYLAATGDGPVGVWRLGSWYQVALLGGKTVNIGSLAFSPDSTALIAASWDENAYLWRGFRNSPQPSRLQHTDWVMSASYSPNGRLIVTASFDGTAAIWDAETLERLTTISVSGQKCYTASFSSDGSLILTTTETGSVELWDATNGYLRATLKGGANTAATAAFSSDGGRVIAGFEDGSVRVWTVPVSVLAI